MDSHTYNKTLQDAWLVTLETELWTIEFAIHLGDNEGTVLHLDMPDCIAVPLGVVDECRRNALFRDAYFSRLLPIQEQDFVKGAPPAVCSMCCMRAEQPVLFSNEHWNVSFPSKRIQVNPTAIICGSQRCMLSAMHFLSKVHDMKRNESSISSKHKGRCASEYYIDSHSGRSMDNFFMWRLLHASVPTSATTSHP